MTKIYFIISGKVSAEHLKTLKHHALFKKTLVLSIISRKCDNELKKMFKEE